jgi:hypothetical protein
MKRNNFSYLLVALLLFIIVLPIAYDLGLASVRVSRFLAISSMLVVGIWSLRGAGRLYTFGMLAVIFGIILGILAIALANDGLHIVSELALFLFLVLAIFNTLRQIAVGNDISPNRIIGAICVYLMLGVIWSIAYSTLEFAQPGSFAGLTELADPLWNPDWLYFSFVTITTLGYGDILPLTQSARSLAFAEAVVGQFYVAVLVAGLVSAYISARAIDTIQE